MRISGRLRNSEIFEADRIHPKLLPSKTQGFRAYCAGYSRENLSFRSSSSYGRVPERILDNMYTENS